MDLRDLRSKFRDDDQRRWAGMVLHLHLADDRNQEECRYLLKFQRQLSMTYCEVTMEELRAHVDAEKLAAVEGLVAALGRSGDEVDRWIAKTVARFPEIEDRGYDLAEGWRAGPEPRRSAPTLASAFARLHRNRPRRHPPTARDLARLLAAQGSPAEARRWYRRHRLAMGRELPGDSGATA